MQNSETNIQNACFLEVGARDDCLVWRQPVGAFRAMNEPKRIIKVGTPGMADASMIVAVTITADMVGKTVGIAVQPEFKTVNGKQAEAQKKWQRAVSAVGGIYRLIRSKEEMAQLVADVKNGNW